MKSVALFLGYPLTNSDLADTVSDLGFSVAHTDEPVNNLSSFGLVVSFGYRHLLKQEVLETASTEVLNLHISLLPHNRGAHPLFWACMENSPTGISIHQIDEGIDTGDIFVQKPIPLQTEVMTFREAHATLLTEIENLFIESVEGILDRTISKTHQTGGSLARRLKDLPEDFNGWDHVIEPEVCRLRKSLQWKQVGHKFQPSSRPSQRSW